MQLRKEQGATVPEAGAGCEAKNDSLRSPFLSACRYDKVSRVKRKSGPTETWKVTALGGQGHLVTESPDAKTVHLSNPSVVVLKSGRIIVSVDQAGPGIKGLRGAKDRNPVTGRYTQGIALTSNDKGESWQERERFPFGHARVFRDGSRIYILGHKGSIQVMKSPNGGETWERPASLTRNDDVDVTLGPANVLSAGGHIYTVFMTNTDTSYRGEPASVLAPVVLRAAAESSLTQARSWTRSDGMNSFGALVPHDELKHFGVPFYHVSNPRHGEDLGKGRWVNRVGWQDSHLLHITDPRHAWHDASGKTLHIVARAHTHRGNYAAVARVTVEEDGRMSLAAQQTPAGTAWTFIPLPGGSRHFSLLYDPPSERFWLLSNDIRDSMTDPLSGGSGVPCDRRGPLILSFSKNLVDWSFAGCIDSGGEGWGIAHRPHMETHGEQLVVVARAIRREGKGQRTDAIRCWTIPTFRELLY